MDERKLTTMAEVLSGVDTSRPWNEPHCSDDDVDRYLSDSIRRERVTGLLASTSSDERLWTAPYLGVVFDWGGSGLSTAESLRRDLALANLKANDMPVIPVARGRPGSIGTDDGVLHPPIMAPVASLPKRRKR